MPCCSRRRFLRGSLALAGLGLLCGCSIPFTRPAQPARLHRIGFLANVTLASNAPRLEAFHLGLREHGYVERQNIAIELRAADGRPDTLPELADELVRLDVDVILVTGNTAIRAAQQATSTIPIVFTLADDPVAEGLVAGLARPGRNATGLTQEAGEENAKRLELLKEGSPGLSRVAVLWGPGSERRLKETEAAAQRLGVQVVALRLERPDDLDTVLVATTAGGADGLIVLGSLVSAALAPQIVDFAAQNRLPATYFPSSFADAGGLMFYGPSLLDSYRRAAGYVDKILKGAKPADLPVEQPTTFEFIINLKAARALGLTIPQSVLQQATELIQ